MQKSGNVNAQRPCSALPTNIACGCRVLVVFSLEQCVVFGVRFQAKDVFYVRFVQMAETKFNDSHTISCRRCRGAQSTRTICVKREYEKTAASEHQLRVVPRNGNVKRHIVKFNWKMVINTENRIWWILKVPAECRVPLTAHLQAPRSNATEANDKWIIMAPHTFQSHKMYYNDPPRWRRKIEINAFSVEICFARVSELRAPGEKCDPFVSFIYFLFFRVVFRHGEMHASIAHIHYIALRCPLPVLSGWLVAGAP